MPALTFSWDSSSLFSFCDSFWIPFPLKPYMLTDVNLRRSIMILPTKAEHGLAWPWLSPSQSLWWQIVCLSALPHESKENGTYQELSLEHCLCLLFGPFPARFGGGLSLPSFSSLTDREGSCCTFRCHSAGCYIGKINKQYIFRAPPAASSCTKQSRTTKDVICSI